MIGLVMIGIVVLAIYGVVRQKREETAKLDPEYGGWVVASVKCGVCNNKWVAMYRHLPDEDDEDLGLECSVCGSSNFTEKVKRDA